MVSLLLALLTSLAGVQAPDDLSKDPDKWPKDVKVIQAIERDLLRAYEKATYPNVPKKTLVLGNRTLELCRSDVKMPCILELDTEAAKTEAKNGLWSPGLAAQFIAANSRPRGIGDVPGIPTADWNSIPTLFPTASPFLISTPVYDGPSALVLVRYNREISWLVSLVEDRAGWRVRHFVIVAIS